MLSLTLSRSDKQLQNQGDLDTVRMFEIHTENSNIFYISAAAVDLYSRTFRKLPPISD